MAILSGYNTTTIEKVCNPEIVGQIAKCPLIWDDFRKTGYVTSHGEDEPSMGTFNGDTKGGFLTPPVDYYLRPYMLAAEELLPIKHKNFMNCLGSGESAAFIYDYAVDFATQFKKDASFSLFWTNSFSHNALDDPTVMDDKIYKYIRTFEERGILNESMIVLLSDHGMRYGKITELVDGYIEERLPFLHIWLPPWFRNQHPAFVEALKINRNRLINPYDVHMTRKHILKLSNPDTVYAPLSSCPKCQSLFTEVPWNRTCEEASIDAFWCTCQTYHECNKSEEIVKDAVESILDKFNQILRKYDENNLCAELRLKEVLEARKSEHRTGNDWYDEYI